MQITYRELKPTELLKINEIDRSETIHEIYEYANGKLILKPDYCAVNSFEEEELKHIIEKQRHIIEQSGKVIGAFDENRLVGVTSVENKKRGPNSEYCKMDILYVSNEYRGKRIGRNLIEECKKTALGFGAKKLYISATPTKATVDFYIKEGAVIAKEIDTELFDLEPLDIHLELNI